MQFAPRRFQTLSLAAMVAGDHLGRRLEAVVDLWFVRLPCSPDYSPTTPPSLGPGVLFQRMLPGYFQGINWERRSAELTRRRQAKMQACYNPGNKKGVQADGAVPAGCLSHWRSNSCDYLFSSTRRTRCGPLE